MYNLEEPYKRLQMYEHTDFPILSVYLDISHHHQEPLEKFEQLIDQTLSTEQKEALQNDIHYMEGFLQNYDRQETRGLALFSGGSTLWEAITTPFRLKDAVGVNHSPYLEPLKQTLKTFHRYLVIAADREKAKLFTLFSNTIEDQKEVMDKDEVPQDVKGRGLLRRANKTQRHIEQHLNRHLDFIAKSADEFAKDKIITGVIVGGHKQLISKLEKHLSHKLQDKIVGEFISEINVSINDIAAKSKQVLPH